MSYKEYLYRLSNEPKFFLQSLGIHYCSLNSCLTWVRCFFQISRRKQRGRYCKRQRVSLLLTIGMEIIFQHRLRYVRTRERICCSEYIGELVTYASAKQFVSIFKSRNLRWEGLFYRQFNVSSLFNHPNTYHPNTCFDKFP